jgi:hypothetical protein
MVLFNILSVMMKCETNLLFFGLGDIPTTTECLPTTTECL